MATGLTNQITLSSKTVQDKTKAIGRKIVSFEKDESYVVLISVDLLFLSNLQRRYKVRV